MSKCPEVRQMKTYTTIRDLEDEVMEYALAYDGHTDRSRTVAQPQGPERCRGVRLAAHG